MDVSREYGLINEIMENSESDLWNTARLEWAVLYMEEDETLSESCVCGYEGLRYLYTIQNVKTGRTLFPIGSECIKKFESTTMNEQVKQWGVINKLASMSQLPWEERTFYKAKELGALNRKFLESLDETDAIKPSVYNQQQPFRDRWFLTDMFNKRDGMWRAQERKANALTGQLIKWASGEIEKSRRKEVAADEHVA